MDARRNHDQSSQSPWPLALVMFAVVLIVFGLGMLFPGEARYRGEDGPGGLDMLGAEIGETMGRVMIALGVIVLVGTLLWSLVGRRARVRAPITRPAAPLPTAVVTSRHRFR